MSEQPASPIVAIVGSTAAGKSALALDLALALGGEIVNADSMQVYRGMDIGTAKASVAERVLVPHHVLDMLDVREPCSVVDVQGWARAAIADCRSRGIVSIVVGGSALYVRAVVDEMSFPARDPVVRERLEGELAERGPAALHAELAARDHAAAAAILPSNGRRIVRALEVVEITGEPFQASLPEPTAAFDGTVWIGLDAPRDVLDERIAARVDSMWAAGFVGEVRRLAAAGLREGRTASRAIGYRQLLAFLAGELTEQDAKDDTVRRTRRFARRQESWFRSDSRVRWLPHDTPDLLDRAVDAVRCVP